MSFQYHVCDRTISQRTAYSQHTQKCIKKIKVEENDEMDTEGDQNNNIEVIVLF